jgi:hypothetical protein
MNLTKGYFTHVLNPIIKDLIKSYCQEMKTDRFDFGDSMLTSSFKGMKNLALKKAAELIFEWIRQKPNPSKLYRTTNA